MKNNELGSYGLKWWYETGAIFRAQGSRHRRVAKGMVAQIAFSLGYAFCKWEITPEGDFNRIMKVTYNNA